MDYDKQITRNYAESAVTGGNHRPSSALELLERVSKLTTAHGLPNFARARGITKKCFWLVVILSMMAGLIFNAVKLTKKYKSYPVSVGVNLVSNQQLVFPSVTICNMNPAKKSAIEAKQKREKSLAKKSRKKRGSAYYCPSGWTQFNGNCYFVSTYSTDFYSANSTCDVMGSQMVSVNDQTELNFICMLSSNQDIWIGLYKFQPQPGSDGYWLDGNPSTFRYWDVSNGEPNEYVSCVRVTGGWFRDRVCSYGYPFICKTPADKRFVITVDNDYALYFDGVQQINIPYQNNWAMTDSLELPWNTRVIAVEAINQGSAGGILASTPDGTILTNSSWKCSNVWSVSWADVEFDDSSWQPAVELGLNGIGPWGSISSVKTNAAWIWNSNQFTDATIYCRLDLQATITTTIAYAFTTVDATTTTPTTTTPTTTTIPTTTRTPTTTSTTTTMPTTTTQTTTAIPTTTMTIPTTMATSTTTTTPITTTTRSDSWTTETKTMIETSATIEPTEAALHTTTSSPTPASTSVTTDDETTEGATTGKLVTCSSTEYSGTTTSQPPSLTTTTAATTTTTTTTTTTPPEPDSSTTSSLRLTTELNSTVGTTTPTLSTSSSSTSVHCCCRCCSDSSSSQTSPSCQFCSDESLTSATDCASQPLPTLPNLTPSPNGPNLETPSLLNGSSFPDRLAYSEDFKQQEQFTEMLASLPSGEQQALGYSASDMILDCQFQNSLCDVDNDFVQFYNPIHGNCYVFNSGWNASSVLYHSTDRGPKNGLRMIVNIDQDNYVSYAGDIAGLRVVVLPQNQIAFPEDEGVTISPGCSAYMAVKEKTIERQPFPYGNCNLKETRDVARSVYSEIYPVQYSTRACENTCYQREVINRCNCSDSHYPSYGAAFGYVNVSVCTISNQAQDDCMYSVGRMFASYQVTCDCPDRCNDVLFDVKTSFALWPNDIRQSKLVEELSTKFGNDLDDVRRVRENLIQLNVYFSDFTNEDISESPAYSAVNFFSDISGVLGLWFGFAIMTFLEFLDFFADLIKLLIYKLI